MSKLPRIFTPISQTSYSNENTNSETFSSNGQNLLTHTDSYKNTLKPLLHSYGFNLSPALYETKINNLEAKLAVLEKSNFTLQNQLKNNEKNFENKLKELQILSHQNKINNNQTEQLMNFIQSKNAFNSNELNDKISKLEQLISKEEEFKEYQHQQEMEIYKKLLSKLTEKVSEAVQIEISARHVGDLKNKIEVENLHNNYNNDMNNVRGDFEEISNQIRREISFVSKECSERTHNVSKYIDMKINEINNGKNDEVKNLKNFTMKLTEQIKNNLITQNDQNSVFESRITNMEKFITNIKDDVYQFIARIEERLIDKMKDIKLYTEVNIKKQNENVDNKLNFLSKAFDNNMNFLADQLSQTRTAITEELNRINKRENERFEYLTNDMETVCNRIYQYEDILKKYDEENKEIKNKIEKDLSDFNSRLDVLFVNERLLHNIEFNNIENQINEIIKKMNETTEAINNNINELNKHHQQELGDLIERINVLQNMLKEMNEQSVNLFNKIQLNEERMEVRLIMDEMASQVDSKFISDLIQKSKDVEFEHDKILKDLTDNIIVSINDNINKNTDNLNKVNSDIKKIYESLNSSGINVSGLKDDLNKLNKKVDFDELRTGVQNTLDKIIQNVDLIYAKERINSIENENDEKYMKAINDLEKNFKNHTKENNEEFSNIKKSIDEVKNDILEKEELNNKQNEQNEMKNLSCQMLNEVEFSNIYDLLKNGSFGQGKDVGAIKDDFDAQYKDFIDNKINEALEKIKNENVEMWNKAIDSSKKGKELMSVRKIINDIPPVILPREDSLRRILDLDYNDTISPIPIVPDLFTNLQDIYNQQHDDYKKVQEMYNQIRESRRSSKLSGVSQNDGASQGSKKSKKSKISNKGENIEENNNNENDNGSKKNSNEDNGSKKSGSKKDNISQSGSKKDNVSQSGSKKDNISQSGSKKDNISQSGSKKDNISQSGSKKDNISQSGSKKDNISQSGSKKDNISQSGSKKDNISQSGSKKDNISQSGSKKDNISQNNDKNENNSENNLSPKPNKNEKESNSENNLSPKSNKNENENENEDNQSENNESQKSKKNMNESNNLNSGEYNNNENNNNDEEEPKINDNDKENESEEEEEKNDDNQRNENNINNEDMLDYKDEESEESENFDDKYSGGELKKDPDVSKKDLSAFNK